MSAMSVYTPARYGPLHVRTASCLLVRLDTHALPLQVPQSALVCWVGLQAGVEQVVLGGLHVVRGDNM